MKLLGKQRIPIIAVALFLFLQATIYADVFFYADGGISADLLPRKELSKTEVQIRAFYASQIQFGDNILLNTGFSVHSENLLSNEMMQNIPALFSLDEFSLLYRFSIENSIGQVSLFAGEYESAGTDTFAQRYLGIKGIGSNLFKKQIGIKQASILPINGLGIAITTRFTEPAAIAFYAYYNEKFTKKHVNIDFRVAGVSDRIVGDFVLGVGLPLDTTDDVGNEVVLIIRRADFHVGLSMLIGNNYTGNVYMQLGITRIQMKPDSDQQVIAQEDFYVFIEPRFVTEKLNVALSLFSIPKSASDLVPYIDNSVGGSISIESMRINMGKNKGVIGGFITASIPNPAITDFDIKNLSIQLVPYTEITVGKGTINVSLQIRPAEYAKFDNLIALSTSYKIEL